MTEIIDVHKVFATYFHDTEALAYAVSKVLEDGSICLDTGTYLDKISNMKEPAGENPFWTDRQHFKVQLEEGRFVTHKSDVLKPFVVHGDKVYLQRYFLYETRIIDNIRRLGTNFRVITGGPGTGKTYSVATELEKLFGGNPELKVALAAPTGKAAARMKESISDFVKQKKWQDDIPEKLMSLNPQTLHRLLGYRRNSVFFQHDAQNPLPYDVLVVDEASMIDGAMMSKVLDAVDGKTKFYLIGDKDQLASVEAGSVFGDICRAVVDKAEKVEKIEKVENKFKTGGWVEMKLKNFRAMNSPQLIEFSQRVIKGDSDYVNQYKNNAEVEIDTSFAAEKMKERALLYLGFIKEKDIKKSLKKLNRVRFLCVTRQHDRSVFNTNQQIEKILRGKINDPGQFNPKPGYYHNQPIIITQNDHNLGINNGDVGLIRRDENGHILKAYFEDAEAAAGYRTIPAGYLNHYETVFAMTIHKSQGSEFEHVVVLLPDKQARRLLTRELLYTAVTRAKNNVLIQSTKDSLKHCIANGVSRASGLTERLGKEGIV